MGSDSKERVCGTCLYFEAQAPFDIACGRLHSPAHADDHAAALFCWRPQSPATCCPFHVDGGDPELPCAPDIPTTHHDFAEMELRVLGLQLHRTMPERCGSMREDFALFYGGTRSGRFPTLPSMANKPKTDTEGVSGRVPKPPELQPLLMRARNPQSRFTPKPPKEKP